MVELTVQELQQLPRRELVKLSAKLQDELRDTRIRLMLSKATIAENQATLKRNSRALARMNRQRRSLKNTVKRRRKNAR